MVSLDGKIIECLPNGKYKVEVEHNGKVRQFACYIGGRVRRNHIIITENDNVKIEISEYDPGRGKIVYRYR